MQDEDTVLFLLKDKSRVIEGDYFFKTDGDVLLNYGKELTVDERDSELASN